MRPEVFMKNRVDMSVSEETRKQSTEVSPF